MGVIPTYISGNMLSNLAVAVLPIKSVTFANTNMLLTTFYSVK